MADNDLTQRAAEFAAAGREQATPLLISVREAAGRTKLSKDTIYKLIAAGKFPHKRIGGVLRIPVRALERWSEPDVE